MYKIYSPDIMPFNHGLPKTEQSVITEDFARDFEKNMLRHLTEREIKLQEELQNYEASQNSANTMMVKDKISKMLK